MLLRHQVQWMVHRCTKYQCNNVFNSDNYGSYREIMNRINQHGNKGGPQRWASRILMGGLVMKYIVSVKHIIVHFYIRKVKTNIK